MKKHLTLIALFVAFVFTAQAQKGDIKVNIGAEVGLPVGDFGDGFGVGFGGTAKGLYGISDEGDISLTIGYIGFGMKDKPSEIKSASTGLTPIMAGYRHSFTGFYLEPQLGFTSVKSKVKSEDIGGFGSFNISGSTTKFSYALGGGIVAGSWDLGVRYQSVSGDGGNLGFFGLRVGYFLPWF